jgi:hypothetical protein
LSFFGYPSKDFLSQQPIKLPAVLGVRAPGMLAEGAAEVGEGGKITSDGPQGMRGFFYVVDGRSVSFPTGTEFYSSTWNYKRIPAFRTTQSTKPAYDLTIPGCAGDRLSFRYNMEIHCELKTARGRSDDN